MGGWKDYILSILVVSAICSIIVQLLPNTGKKELLHILQGVLLSIVILQPLSKVNLNDFLNLQQYAPESADLLLAMGQETAEEAKRQYITDQYEAYILDKAKAMGAEILPVITVDDAFLPVSADIQGDLDPTLQNTLEQIMTDDMGITKENQRWTGNPDGKG